MNIPIHFSFGILRVLVASVCTGAGLDEKRKKNILFFIFENQGAGSGSPL